ncbi:MAG: hypothetical protein UV61_C0021G0009 [Candidatus Gottesmanbacteria bacterium GW2011_GWB1_43_11]|uniref:Carbonic anhydrase n=1 Tax=Candidatus Gottesmanbacteria bacterium GW2011_GWB1_43_11 TaxID=1618446 RepID=A0A0G1FE38_9BACT|nr:MAG: hypothetical protein UV17_C0023G0004 [Candidatus Gottesmanbacteria bacterium GW2011_GWA1_42_26]KKS80865.1 MAG: hypothetical protein UV55_C0027G0005 [Candidatus Gottesmanbacteria bacterium GW2011_GWC1_43_10]KKS85093.1 MAG: hypothetical protein UV61_C0021G0009 [Candidatus Gottesmanbacteria bacterium GW2011_GWB1_43_11]OGG07649.1 MAG: hypothetical protein A2699_06160 [Candidatus Gottesmanbacteria bacterium RIFCSPHIGHO2_01_FULL_43_15]HCM38288.1 hypothetical protein [Patescibacteria group bac
MAHSCSTLVATCIDFRFQKAFEAWMNREVGVGNYDRVAWAGGVKDLGSLLNQLDISVRLHHIQKVILVNHEDCGAYGAAGTLAKHEEDLQAAATKIAELYPQLQVELYFARLNGNIEKVS